MIFNIVFLETAAPTAKLCETYFLSFVKNQKPVNTRGRSIFSFILGI